MQGHNNTCRGSAEARTEHLGHTTPDLHSTGGNSAIRNQNDNEGHDPGIQQLSGSAPERTSGGGRDGEPGRPRGKSSFSNYTASVLTTTVLAKERGWVDRAIGRAAFAVELAKGPAEAFTPLKAVLASISSVYAQYQVCFYAPFKPPL